MASDFQNAKAWIKRAYEVAALSASPESEKLKQFQSYVKRPQSHPAAGLFQRAKLSGPPMTE